MKLPADEDIQTRGDAPFYVDEKAVNDYYPFGMLISDDGGGNRSWQAGNYRYGYNGQERSLEIDPNGNHNTAEFWEYDARAARRWNLDPVDQMNMSNYTTFKNNPIMMIDPEGDISHGFLGTDQKIKEYEANSYLQSTFRSFTDAYTNKKDPEKEVFMMWGWTTDFDNAKDWEIRRDEAKRLAGGIFADYMAYRQGEIITLIGYSYGGDVAMRVALELESKFKAFGMEVTIQVVSLSTPLDENVVNTIGKSKNITINHYAIEGDGTVALASGFNEGNLFLNKGQKSFSNGDGTYKFNQHFITKDDLNNKNEVKQSEVELLKKHGRKPLSGRLFGPNHGWIYYPSIVKKALRNSGHLPKNNATQMKDTP